MWLRLVPVLLTGSLAIGCAADECTPDAPGRVCFLPDNGAAIDHTDSVAAGTAAAPARLQLDHDGTLAFGPGSYYVRLDVAADRARITGAGSANTALLGGALVDPEQLDGTVIRLAGERTSLAVEGLRVEDGAGAFGGAISAQDPGQQVTIRDVVFRNNHANGSTQAVGGAVLSVGTLVVEDATFIGNRAGDSGGAIYASGPSTVIRRTRFEDNEAYTGGAVMAFGETLLVSDCELSGNHAFSSGGAVELERLAATFERTRIVDNHVTFGVGGGVTQFDGTATFTEVTINANSSDRGGGMAVLRGSTTFGTSKLDGNDALALGTDIGVGGALWIVDAGVTASDTSISGNSAITGTAVLLDREGGGSSFTAERCAFSVNVGPVDAPEIANVQVDGSSFTPGENASFRCDLTGCR